jgi:hypothetical protein
MPWLQMAARSTASALAGWTAREPPMANPDAHAPSQGYPGQLGRWQRPGGKGLTSAVPPKFKGAHTPRPSC